MKRLLMMFLCVSGVCCDALETKNIYRTIKRTVESRTKQSIGYAIVGVASIVGIALFVKRRFNNSSYESINSGSLGAPSFTLELSGFDKTLAETQYEEALRRLVDRAGKDLHETTSFTSAMGYIDRGIDPDYKYNGQTLLQLACKSGNFPVAKQLVEKKGAKVDDGCWFNALQVDRASQYKKQSAHAYNAWHQNRVQLLELLKHNGANINASCEQGTAWKQAENKDNLLQSYLLACNAQKA